MRVTERQWSTREDCGPEVIRTLTTSYLDQVGSALTGNWRTT